MPDDHGQVEGMLSNCEEEVRLLYGMLDEHTGELTMLRGQLADLTRQNQRLLTVQADMAREITGLRAQLALVEAAASV